jgi:hypothetical protein
MAGAKGIQQAARRVRRRFGHFGWHSPRLDNSADGQKKFSEAGVNATCRAEMKWRQETQRHDDKFSEPDDYCSAVR